jgi:hypothetical protein
VGSGACRIVTSLEELFGDVTAGTARNTILFGHWALCHGDRESPKCSEFQDK